MGLCCLELPRKSLKKRRSTPPPRYTRPLHPLPDPSPCLHQDHTTPATDFAPRAHFSPETYPPLPAENTVLVPFRPHPAPITTHVTRPATPHNVRPPSPLHIHSHPVVHDDRMTRMAFDRNFRAHSDAAMNTIIRGAEHQQLINDLLARFHNADLLSRDDTIRLGGARAFGGLSDRARVEELITDDMVRRINLMVQYVNNMVTTRMSYAEVHPKMTDNGHYPREFERPRRVEELLSMENSTLDRLLSSYGLPRDIRPGLGSPIRTINPLFSDGARGSKLGVLFEYLGVITGDEFRGLGLLSSSLERSRLSGGLGEGYRNRLGM